MSRDVRADALEAYEAAQERLVYVREQWVGAGRPLLGQGSHGGELVHPLFKLLQDSEMMAARLREKVDRQHRGPEPSATVQPKLGASPAAKLRKSA